MLRVLELDIRAVESYQKSAEMNYTLGMSNLANKYLNAGFLAQAEKLCEDALRVPDYHPNIADTLKRIKRTPKQEQDKEEEIASKARPYSEFLKQFGKATTQQLPSNFPKKWLDETCTLSVSIDGSDFIATGEYEQAPPGLTNALAAGLGPSYQKATLHKVEYRGKIKGRAIDATVKRTDSNLIMSLMTQEPEYQVLLFLVDDGQKILALQSLLSKFPRLYAWTRA